MEYVHACGRGHPRCYHGSMPPEDKERLRLTIQGLIGAALSKFPHADKGTLKTLWNEEVDKRLKGKRSAAKKP